MKNFFTRFQEIFNLFLAITAIVIAVMRIFGFFKNDNLDEQIPNIILFFVGAIVLNSVLERRITFSRLESKFDNTNNLIAGDNLNKLDNITRDINPLLQLIFKDYLKSFYLFFEDAIKNNRIEFYDIDRFRFAFIRTLSYKQEDKNTFWATSLPYKRYFWATNESTAPMSKALKEFIDSGGEFIRIFFCKKEDLDFPETINILNSQVELGIKVYFIQTDKVPGRLQQYFVVDKNEELAWEASIDIDQRINLTAFTTSKKEIEKYKSIFQELMNLDDLKEYTNN